nr:putative G3BP-like protein isoform X1 [Ipomoea batatas]
MPFNITVAELEAEFNKYGPIKHGGIQVRSNRDSPIMIGDRQAVVEIKRTTTRGEFKGVSIS